MNKKKSYFLSIDAFVAVIMIVLGFVIINSQFYYEPYTTQHEIYSRDFMNSLTLQIPEYNVEHYKTLALYKKKGFFDDYTLSLLDYIIKFVVLNGTNCENCYERAFNLTNETIKNKLTSSYSVKVILINNYDDEDITLLNITRSNIENAKTITTSKKMVTVVENDKFHAYLVKVVVWS